MAKHNALPKGITLKINGSFAVAVMVKGVRKSGTASTLAEAVSLREALVASIKTGKEVPKFRTKAMSTPTGSPSSSAPRPALTPSGASP